MTYIIATVDTGSFEWMALGASPQECNVALTNAYAGHCAKMPDADPDLMRELVMAHEINYAEIQMGQALRDGSPVSREVAK